MQKKWANLRTCFRRELNNQKKTKPYVKNRRTEDNLKSDTDDSEESDSSTFTSIPPRRKKKINVYKQTDLDEVADEDRNFALSLVPSLQNLSAEEKLDAKIAILNVFKQIRRARLLHN